MENRRPLLRASASGVTCAIDSSGRLRSRLPIYEEGYLVVEVPLLERRKTLYTRLGDWFPLLLAAMSTGGIAALVILNAAARRKGKKFTQGVRE